MELSKYWMLPMCFFLSVSSTKMIINALHLVVVGRSQFLALATTLGRQLDSAW
ncbi:hypothetical protein LINPERPRIM_LOCUS40353 [Linum perenne]